MANNRQLKRSALEIEKAEDEVAARAPGGCRSFD